MREVVGGQLRVGDGGLSHLVKDAVRSVRDVDGDLRSAQLGEGFGVQNEQESAFVLQR